MADKDIEQKIKLTYETNADDVSNDVNKLGESMDKTIDATDQHSKVSAKAVESNKKMTASVHDNTNAVSKNGGAMGILNMITGGYAQIVKDAMEAAELFTVVKEVDTTVTTVQTTSTVSNNTATQQGILAKIKDAAAWTLSTIAKGAAAVATGVVTAAQWLWNVAVMANPLVAFVVAIVATAAAIYKLTTFLLDSKKANEDAAVATAKHTKELEAQSVAATRAVNALRIHNDQQYAMAKAAGASSDALRKLSLRHAEEEIALNKKNAELARGTFLRERNTLAELKAADASDEVIAAQEKLSQGAYKEFQEQNNLLDASYKDRATLRRSNEVEILTEQTTASTKLLEERKAAAAKEREQQLKDYEERKKERLRQIDDLLKSEAEQKRTTEQEIIDADKERTKTADEEKEAGLKTKTDLEEHYAAEQIEIEKRILEQKEAVEEAKQNLANNAVGFLTQLAGKNKTLQKAAIIAESALGIGRSIIATNAANVAATAQGIALSIPTFGASEINAARLVTMNTVSAGIGIAGNIAATAKALQSLGGGSVSGGASSIGGGGRSSGGSSAAPQVNFQGSKENQIGNTLAGKLNAQAPIRVTVLESDISKAQTSVTAKVVSNSF